MSASGVTLTSKPESYDSRTIARAEGHQIGKTSENVASTDADEKSRFEKILKTLGRKEPNLDHRLDELKYMYELNKYDELLNRLNLNFFVVDIIQ